jgi:uncharacterized protein YbaP (TraB family)
VSTTAIACALVAAFLQEPAVRPAAPPPVADNKAPVPFLWRVDGAGAPAYLFGTIHVPDPRVLTLAPPVKEAFARAGAVYTEIPLDLGTEVALGEQLLLGSHTRLRDIIGEPLFQRLTGVVSQSLAAKLPPEGVSLLVGMLDRLKPWAAMAQVALIDYLPDLAAGRQALDAALYADARAAKKTVGGIESLVEQVAAFEAFTLPEQTELLRSALDDLERDRAKGITPADRLVTAYRAGNLDALSALLDDGTEDPVLARKFRDKLVVERNARMAKRIATIRRTRPTEVQFFAIGALHMAGNDGVPALLARDGFTVTRVVAPAGQ